VRHRRDRHSEYAVVVIRGRIVGDEVGQAAKHGIESVQKNAAAANVDDQTGE
jgi:hypothetical protein